ncbi:MAG: hypothetical protein SGCHY_000093 [Lobulomycetales sp.]
MQVFQNFAECAAIILYLYVLFEAYLVPIFLSMVQEKGQGIKPLALAIFTSIMPCMTIFLFGFFGKWNNVVYDWLFAYVYIDAIAILQTTVGLSKPRAKSLAALFVIQFSAMFHEIILACSMGHFFPFLWITYGGPGILFTNWNPAGKRPSMVPNMFVWCMLMVGMSLLICTYARENFMRTSHVTPDAGVFDKVFWEDRDVRPERSFRPITRLQTLSARQNMGNCFSAPAEEGKEKQPKESPVKAKSKENLKAKSKSNLEVSAAPNRLNFQEFKLSADSFLLQRSLGKGAFGKVRVVQHPRTGEAYALKYIDKARCIEMKAVENIIAERKLLEEISSTFVVNLRYAFQDAINMYMVIDLMTGGDLRFHLDQSQRITQELAAFWMAEMSYALSVLHSRNIIHRDLKPDNVLLDVDGHVYLTDFNIGCHFPTDPKKKLFSVAGSMAYMAPEMLSRKGYRASIDWWSLGVILFELIFGKRPFSGRHTDELVSNIMNQDVAKCFPSKKLEVCDQSCIDFITLLLNRDITQRIGTVESGGFEKLKKDRFFSSIKWNKLTKKELQPPFVPETKKANCDATFELDGLLMDDVPLQAKDKNKKNMSSGKRSAKKPTSFSTKDSTKDSMRSFLNLDDPEIRKYADMMNEKFRDYDFEKAGEWKPSSTYSITGEEEEDVDGEVLAADGNAISESVLKKVIKETKDINEKQPNQESKDINEKQPNQESKDGDREQPGQDSKDGDKGQPGQDSKEGDKDQPGQESKDINQTGQESKDGDKEQPGQESKDINQTGQESKDGDKEQPGQDSKEGDKEQPGSRDIADRAHSQVQAANSSTGAAK